MDEKEAYKAAYYFLMKWYEITKSDDLGEILSPMELLDDGEPADPIMWDYWKEAVEKVMRDGFNPEKKFV